MGFWHHFPIFALLIVRPHEQGCSSILYVYTWSILHALAWHVVYFVITEEHLQEELQTF